MVRDVSALLRERSRTARCIAAARVQHPSDDRCTLA